MLILCWTPVLWSFMYISLPSSYICWKPTCLYSCRAVKSALSRVSDHSFMCPVSPPVFFSEQRAIVKMNVAGIVRGSENHSIRWAYAGNGKTTTLAELTKRNPNIRSSVIVSKFIQQIFKISKLLLSFNRPVNNAWCWGAWGARAQLVDDAPSSVKIDKLSYHCLVLLMVEAQNMNPVVLDICLNQVSLEHVNFEG